MFLSNLNYHQSFASFLSCSVNLCRFRLQGFSNQLRPLTSDLRPLITPSSILLVGSFFKELGTPTNRFFNSRIRVTNVSSCTVHTMTSLSLYFVRQVKLANDGHCAQALV